MEKLTRRDFLVESGKKAAGIAMGGFALSALGASKVWGANERVRIALIGCGGRGSYVTYNLVRAGAEVVYLCDLHPDRLNEVAGFLSEHNIPKPKFAKDMRTVLDDKSVDAVVVATPDHWHAPASILACQAGKDVYVEKPHCHNIFEGQKLLEAARKYKRVVQVGTQNRSGPYTKAAAEYIKSGKLGPIYLVKIYNMKPGKAYKLGKAGTKHAEFDWDTWLGPAPERPYHQRLFDGGWHKFWDFSGGDMADDGIHQIDLALMAMQDPGLPKAVSCAGGHIAFKDDDSEVPDVQVVSYDYGDFVMTFEQTEYTKYMEKTSGTIRRNDLFPYWTQNATRIELYGTEMLMTLGRHGGGWQVMEKSGKVADQMFGRPCDEPHAQNFLECVKSRARSAGDPEVINNSSTLIHMANIAHRVGNKTLHYDAKAGRFTDSDEANKMIKRVYRDKYKVPDVV